MLHFNKLLTNSWLGTSYVLINDYSMNRAVQMYYKTRTRRVCQNIWRQKYWEYQSVSSFINQNKLARGLITKIKYRYKMMPWQHNDVKWAPWCPRSQATRLLVLLLVSLSTMETSNVHIAGLLWGNSHHDEPVMGKVLTCYDVFMSQ